MNWNPGGGGQSTVNLEFSPRRPGVRVSLPDDRWNLRTWDTGLFETQALNPLDTKIGRPAWESRVSARVLERFRREMGWHKRPNPAPLVPVEREHGAAGWAERESAALEASVALAGAGAALRREKLGVVYRWLSRALELDPFSFRAIGVRGWLRFLRSDPASCNDFDVSLVYANWSRFTLGAAMSTRQDLAPVDFPGLRPRTASGEWNGDALVAAFLHPTVLEAAGPHLAELASTLREFVVSHRAVQRFAGEMGWPAAEQNSFANLDPRLLDNAESWLRYTHALLRRGANGSREVVDARLAVAFEAASQGAPMADMETALPEESSACPARTAFIRGESAWRNRMPKRAVQDFERLVALAPHVTVGHRRLGQIALTLGDPGGAARHFEAAVAIPNQRWMSADQSDDLPVLVARVGTRLDIYRYRGGLYPVPRTPNFMGVTVVAGRLIRVYDTPAYRLWHRIKLRPEVIARLRSPGLRSRAKRGVHWLAVALSGVLVFAAERVPGAKSGLRRLAGLFGGSGVEKVEPVPGAPGRLMSIALRLARPFRGTRIGRLFRRLQARFAARRFAAAIGTVSSQSRLVVLRTVFRAKEMPSGLGVRTVEELIERLGQRAAWT